MEPFPENDQQLSVLEDMHFPRDHICLSLHDPVPLEVFAANHMAIVTHGAPRRPRSAPLSNAVREQLLLEFPWLTPADFGDTVRSARRSLRRAAIADRPERALYTDEDSASADDAADGHADAIVPAEAVLAGEEGVVVPHVEAIDIASLIAEVVAVREEYAHDDACEMWFYVHNRGGTFTHVHHRVATDYATCFARASALEFCRIHS
jgi:hypothetical protein